MDIEYRGLGDDDFEAFMVADERAFGYKRNAERPQTWARGELDRARAAYEGRDIVGVGRNYSFELTMPGGSYLPAAAVSWIGVLPTHRRRGILTGMMQELHDEARERGEAMSMLTASESVIYGRFGYGCATWQLGLTVERSHGAFARPFVDPGRVRLVDTEEAQAIVPSLYEQTRSLRAGAVSRPDFWWPECYFFVDPEHDPGAWFDVVHDDEHGAVDGYATYSVRMDWPGGVAGSVLRVEDIISTNDTARVALWRYLLGVDLVHSVVGRNIPVDEPLRFLLADPRRMRVDYVNDRLWIRVHEPAAALAARTYATAGRLVLEVHEISGAAARYELEGGPDGAQCRVATAEPDLVLPVAQLGAVLLGGTPWAQLAAAGLIEERTPGALVRADAMFACAPAPATCSWF